MKTRKDAQFTIGIDIGGTFTDVVAHQSDGAFHLVKIPTTPGNPDLAVRQAMSHMLEVWGIAPGNIARFTHGTTAATNAVLERKGAKTGLLTTDGFRDVIEIGRAYRRDMYDLVIAPQTPAFLVPGGLRKGVRERIRHTGEVLVPLDEASVRDSVQSLLAEGVESVAVCFLFSFVNPAHEIRTRELIADMAPELSVALSHEVDPTFREYERTCATVFDAYVKPVLDRYLGSMECDLMSAGVPAALQIMQSRGGLSSSKVARRRPVRLFMSGPAAGVIGGVTVGALVGRQDLITVDIGGTSCDIALVSAGQPLVRAEGLIDGFPVRAPMVDVNAIGSGGGSIAWIDAAGGLKVGPQSAGAAPGPACYGFGGDAATVTDASVVLGYLSPDYFAGGSMKLDVERAREVIADHIAKPLGVSVDAAALGIHRVINAQMAEGIRLVSIGRGIDPRGFALVAMGGAGPMHATALATELGMAQVIVPPHPGVLSAWGLLSAPIEHEATRAVHQPLGRIELTEIVGTLHDLDRQCDELMAAEHFDPNALEIFYTADVCYEGQSYVLEVPLHLSDADDVLQRLYRDFLEAHDRVYGHSFENPAKIVNLRAVHRVRVPTTFADQIVLAAGEAVPKGRRTILTSSAEHAVEATIWDREALTAGVVIDGPAIVEQPDTTTLIESGWQARLADGACIILTRN